MAYTSLQPLPFCPIPGRFDLTTYVQGSSDYEIMAKLIETYNKAVSLFNQLLEQYGNIDSLIEDLGKVYQAKLDEYQNNIDNEFESFKNDVSNKVNMQNSKIEELAQTVVDLNTEVQKVLNGEYIDVYVKALATWIDNNLQVLVQKVVKYVWFDLTEDGYFRAHIPDNWDFMNFDTELDPDNADYGKLALLWEPEVIS